MKLEKILYKLLIMDSCSMNQEEIDNYITQLADMVKSKYMYTKQNERFVLFSNHDLINLPKDKEILMICSHFDTVNQNGMLPDIDKERNIVYGRGTVDDKANIATVISLTKEIKFSDKVIIIGITFDEETEVLGSKQLVNCLKELGVKPDNVLLAEPTNMNPSCNSHGEFEGHYWNRLEQSEDNSLFRKLKEMNMGYALPITPPCEAGDYKKLGSNVVICGPGYMNLCHSIDERIEISSLYEWRKRLKWLIQNKI